MKSIIILVAAIFISGTFSFSQKLTDDKVPAAVKASFKAKFPNVTAVTWEMEDQKEYEASFKLNNTETTASFDLKGKWMETEGKIDIAKLPKAVSETIAKQFAGFTIKVAEQTVTEKSTTYEVSLVKGTEKKSVALSDKGVVLPKESEKDEKDEKEKK